MIGKENKPIFLFGIFFHTMTVNLPDLPPFHCSVYLHILRSWYLCSSLYVSACDAYQHNLNHPYGTKKRFSKLPSVIFLFHFFLPSIYLHSCFFSEIFVFVEDEDRYEGNLEYQKEQDYLTIRFSGTHVKSDDSYNLLLDFMEKRKPADDRKFGRNQLWSTPGWPIINLNSSQNFRFPLRTVRRYKLLFTANVS